MRIALKLLAGSVVVVAACFALAIAFGGPGTPPPLASIADPFKSVDFSDLPPLRTFLCRGGDTIAYREYAPAQPAPAGTVVLVHGSAGDSRSMHPMGKALARAGYRALALDMRGHGASGLRGQAKFVGHLEYDIDDFLKATGISGATMIGFSSGGGFALRYAASERQDNFARYVLLAPFVSHEAPTYRPDGGGWVSVGVPRIVGLLALNGIGVTSLNHLPVMRFAVTEEGRKTLTAEYSYALAMNYRPPRDYAAAIRAIRQPTSVLVGEKDELFLAGQFEPLFALLNPLIPVAVIPGLSHIGLAVDPRGIDAVISEIRRPRPEAAGSRG